MRIGKTRLHELCDYMNRVIPGKDFMVQYAYGQPRLYRAEKRGGKIVEGAIEVSPRMPPHQLHTWMSAFLSGYSMGFGDAQMKYTGE